MLDLRHVYAAKLFQVISNLAAGTLHWRFSWSVWQLERAPQDQSQSSKPSSLTNLQAVCSCHSKKRGYKLQLRVTFWLQSGLSCHYVSFLRGKCWCTPCLQWIWIYTLLQQSFWRRGSFELLWKTFLKIKIAEARHRKWATGFKTLHPSQLQVLEFLPAVPNAAVWMRLWRILLAGVVPSGALLPSACRISYILEHSNYLWRVSTWKKLKL